MDLTSRPPDQARQDAGGRQSPAAGEPDSIDQLRQTIEELHVHRVEMEMQNRALQETRNEIEDVMQRYADLYDHLPIGYVTLSAAGEILEANLTAASWLRVDRPALRGSFLNRFLSPFDAGRFAGHLERCLESEAERAFDTALQVKNEAPVAVQITSRLGPKGRDGQRHILCAITNVSQLRHSQQVLGELRRDHEVFGESISHDLRSPLVTISTYARILQADYGSTLVPEVKGMVERIQRASQRMEGTLEKLLAYNVLLREEPLLQDTCVDDVVHGVLAEFRSEIQERQADIEVRSPLPFVRGCPSLLAPAVSNLISNALKFTPPGTVPRITISGEERGQFAVLKFLDEGIGIDSQHHDRIFRAFDRLHRYADYPGAGIGLAIVRRAVERMHGQVWVESEKGKGSCFYVMLPR